MVHLDLAAQVVRPQRFNISVPVFFMQSLGLSFGFDVKCAFKLNLMKICKKTILLFVRA